METRIRSSRERLLRRRCVVCGFDGDLVQDHRAERCTKCDCDLRDRPARSYAEMEGLIGQPTILDRPLLRMHGADDQPERLLMRRWLSFFLFLVMLTIGVVYLGLAAMP